MPTYFKSPKINALLEVMYSQFVFMLYPFTPSNGLFVLVVASRLLWFSFLGVTHQSYVSIVRSGVSIGMTAIIEGCDLLE